MKKGESMKKILVFLTILILIIVVYLLKGKKKEDYLVKINNYIITEQEFESEFKDSAYAKSDNLESRKEFLSGFIKRKLILQDAQRSGLDKDKKFLKMIEKFWEQSLLKLAIDDKVQKNIGSYSVSDRTVQEEYNKLQQNGKADKPYEQMYNQIKWSLMRSKESQAIDKWITGLYKNAHIEANSSYTIMNDNKDIKSMVHSAKDVK